MAEPQVGAEPIRETLPLSEIRFSFDGVTVGEWLAYLEAKTYTEELHFLERVCRCLEGKTVRDVALNDWGRLNRMVGPALREAWQGEE